MSEKPSSFQDILKQINNDMSYTPIDPLEDQSAVASDQHFPVSDSMDNAIVMHRDCHFGGDFATMLEYYQDEDAKGVEDDFEIEYIERLAMTEKSVGQNLAASLLSGAEAEKVANARSAYARLKEIYEVTDESNPTTPRLIADLILTENSEAEEEIQALVNQGEEAVPALIELIQSELFYDPLFPGYGLAPSFAIQCLGSIGSEKAIAPIFEEIDKQDFFVDEEIFKALKKIGDPAKAFLLKVMTSRPFTKDNEHACMALMEFKDEQEVAEACFEQLQDPEVQENLGTFTNLTLACEGLKDLSKRDAYKLLSQREGIPEEARAEMELVISAWASE